MNKLYQWAVIGAGPAGIAAVGKLLDHGIDSRSILWCDPEFKVGDLGLCWSNVSSNTRVKYFKDFLFDARSFAFQKIFDTYQLSRLDESETCILQHVVDPLQNITVHLQQQVVSQSLEIERIRYANNQWYLYHQNQVFNAQKVILAIGSEPKSLAYSYLPSISLKDAVDPFKLARVLDKKDTVAVFGSSHSAIIVLQNLVELGVKKIFNFYRSPCRYALQMDDWILFDNTGLKGNAAHWAKCYVDGQWPRNLERYGIHDEAIDNLLPQCDRLIPAIGFEPRRNLIIEGYDTLFYNPYNGIIAPGLFGCGIAYPELKADPYGHVEYQVGLWKFMKYLNKVMPIWLLYP